jgi:hypothetical protein
MKKVIKSISFLILLFTVNLSFASAFISITEMQVNGVPIDNYGTIPFGSNTSVNLYFKLSINKSGSVSDFSTFYLYLRKDASTTPLLLDGIMVNNSAFDSQGHWYGYFSKTIYASDIANSGSCLYGKYQDDTTNPSSPIVYDTTDCYSLSKIAPSFTLSPAPLYLYCGDTGPYTFTVTPSNIPTGATVSYSWSYSGWSGNPSTTNSITLSTTTGYNLPGWVYVTPYINNVAQPQLSCQITRATQLTGAAITGPTGVCSGSANYTISNLNVASGEIVFNWFLTDSATSNSGYTSGPIASLSNQSNTGVTVTFNSSNTALYIKAIVKNLCGQNVIKSFQIRDGAAIFTSAATMTGNTSGICNPGDQKTFNINNLQPTETLQWSISDTDIASLSVSADGLQATVTATGSGSGSQTVTANITNTCGQICTKNKTFYIGTPTFNKFTYGCTNRSLCIASDANYAFTSPTILNTKNRVIANFFGLTATEAANSANWQWQEAPGNHLLYINTTSPKNYLDLCPIAAGTTILQVRAKNSSCNDFSEWVDLPITIVQLPSSMSFRQTQSPGVVSLRDNDSNTLGNIENTQYLWANNNIWVRNNQDGIIEHQNPVFNESSPNYMYVRIANTGCTGLPGGIRLKTYWAKAATSLNWPQSWNDSKYNNTETSLGGQIGEVALPELGPEQEIIISMPFMVPNPDKYNNIVNEPWRFGLLARAVSESDEAIGTETDDLVQNLINNENIALKNVTVVDLANDNPEEQTIGGVIAVGNTFDTPKSFYLELVKEDLETGKPIYDEAEVSLKLDETLYQAWVRGGKTAERLDNTLDDKMKLVKDNNVFLKDLELNPNETGTLYVKFNFLTKEITDKSKYMYHVIQRETGTNKIIGGQTYVIKKQQRPLFTADAGGTKYVDKNEPITISAAQISESVVYNWYDADGNFITSGKDLNIATEIAQKYKLEVIAADGFKDYTEVEVKLNPNTLGTISPNPVVNSANITYKINEASSAYLMILGGYGTTGDSNNYILDIDSSGINIDLSYYSSGFYTVALVCDGQIVDAKTLVKE